MREWVRAEEGNKAAIWGEAGKIVEGNTDRRVIVMKLCGKRKRKQGTPKKAFEDINTFKYVFLLPV